MHAGKHGTGPMITVDERLFVGVDWGNEHHQLCAVDGSGGWSGNSESATTGMGWP